MVGFCKGWAVEKCTEPLFKMFQKPRNEQNQSGYFFLKHPVFQMTTILDLDNYLGLSQSPILYKLRQVSQTILVKITLHYRRQVSQTILLKYLRQLSFTTLVNYIRQLSQTILSQLFYTILDKYMRLSWIFIENYVRQLSQTI